MTDYNQRRMLGGLLIIAGVISLLFQFEILQLQSEYIVASIFAVLGLGLILSYFVDRRMWKLFCGMFLVFIALPIFNSAAHMYPDDLTGTAFLWMFALVFFLIFGRDRSQWWAIMPAGILLSLGGLVAAQAYHLADDEVLAGFMFVGFFLTFAFLYFIRDARTRTGWAIWPAGIFLGIALIIFANYLDLFFYTEYWLPALFILAGVYLVAKNLISGKKPSNPYNHA